MIVSLPQAIFFSLPLNDWVWQQTGDGGFHQLTFLITSKFVSKNVFFMHLLTYMHMCLILHIWPWVSVSYSLHNRLVRQGNVIWCLVALQIHSGLNSIWFVLPKAKQANNPAVYQWIHGTDGTDCTSAQEIMFFGLLVSYQRARREREAPMHVLWAVWTERPTVLHTNKETSLSPRWAKTDREIRNLGCSENRHSESQRWSLKREHMNPKKATREVVFANIIFIGTLRKGEAAQPNKPTFGATYIVYFRIYISISKSWNNSYYLYRLCVSIVFQQWCWTDCLFFIPISCIPLFLFSPLFSSERFCKAFLRSN